MTRYIVGTTYGLEASSDLIDWDNKVPVGTDGDVRAAFFSGGLFGFVANTSNTQGVVYTSPDPFAPISAWRAVPLPLTGRQSFISRFIEDGSRWLLLDTPGFVHVSDDSGATWTAHQFAAAGASGWDITKHGNRYVIVGGGRSVWASSDLITWGHEYIGGSTAAVDARGVASNGSTICAVLANGQIWEATTLGAWTLRATFAAFLICVKTFGGMFVATGSTGLVARRIGLSWASALIGVDTYVYDIIYDVVRVRYIIVTSSGKRFSSPNLVAWTEVAPGTYSTCTSIAADTGGPPYRLFGTPFQGFDRDATVTITRQIQVQESEGGSVTLIPTAPAEFDSWDIEAGFMVNAAQAQVIEASLPPYGTPSEGIMRLPPRNGEASFPGLLPMTYAGAPTDYDSYTLPLTSPVDVQGRVAVRADLFSYRLAFRFYAASATLNNRPTATSTTAPVWLTGKFAQHGISDPSTHVPTIQAGVGPTINFNFHPTKQGRTKRITITLDCLSQARADELVGFFRGVRHNATMITLDNGANGFQAVSVYLTGLSFTRGDGLYWTGSLEVVLA